MGHPTSKVLPVFFLTLFIILCFNHAIADPGPTDGPAIGIITHLPLDETSSGTYADVYNGNYGPFNGTCSGDCPSPVAGYVNGAQQFNGTSSKIDIPYDPAFNWGPHLSPLKEDSFSIEFWMNKTSACSGTADTDSNVIVGRDGTGGSLDNWWVGVNCNSADGQGLVKFNLIDSSASKAVFSNTNVIDGEWHHIAAVRNGVDGQNYIYVDGVLEGSANQTYTGGFDATTPINIGWINLAAGPGYYYNGIVDEVSIYNRALSQDEISFHHTQGSCGRPIRIMPVGDSITKGTETCQDPDFYLNCIGYRGPLWQKLIENGYNVDFVGDQGGYYQSQYHHDNNHLGYGAWTPSQIDGIITDRLNTFKPDVVVLHIGTNNTGEASYVESILNKIDAFEGSAGGNEVSVVLALIINRESFDQSTADFNDAVYAMAFDRIYNPSNPAYPDNIIIVDMENGIGLDYPIDLSGLHPLASGYLKMAWEGTESWYNALETFLPVCGPITPTAPNIYSTPVATAYVGYEYVYDVNATGYPTPSYSLDVYPTGMQIDAGGVIRWTPSGTGQETVRVIASNGVSPDDQQEFTIDVIEALECPQGIIHYWDLNDASGPPYEDKVGATPATCSGDNCPVLASGQVDSSVDFDGNDELVTQGTANPTSGITVMAWINPDDFSNGLDQGIVIKNDVFFLELESNQNYMPEFSVMVNNGTQIGYGPTGTGVPLGEWTHVVGTYDGTIVKLYMNGSEIGTGIAGSGTLDSNSNAYVIGHSGLDLPLLQQRYFFGKIDEVAVFDRALNLAEIQEIYAKGMAGNPYCTEGVPPGVTVFSDEFITDTRGQYDVNLSDYPGQTGSGQFLWDETGQRAQVVTGDNIAVKISKSVNPLRCGSFGFYFFPIEKFPNGGTITIRLFEDENNYYQIKSSDGYAPEGIIKIVDTVQADSDNFVSGYVQGQAYNISINFSPDTTTVEAFGQVLEISTDASDISVNRFEIRLSQQTAYLDNILLTSCMAPGVPPSIDSTPAVTAIVGQLYSYDVNATGTEPITYSLTESPTGMQIFSNGLINWIPGPGDVGSAAVTVVATNDYGTDDQIFSILVSDACTEGVWPLGTIAASGNAGTIQSVTYCGETYFPGTDLISGTTTLYNNSDEEVASTYPAPGADDFSFDQTVHTTDSTTVYYLQTIFGGLYDTFFVFENGGNSDATWYGVRSDDTLTSGIWVDASETAGDTGYTTGIGSYPLKGYVFKTMEPVKGIRILPGNSLDVPNSTIGFDAYSISTLASSGVPTGLDFGDAPDPMYPTLLANNGARHTIVTGTYLGTSVDEEADGQQTASAVGDDNDGSDDEDGVVLTSTLVQGVVATVDVTASVAGKLNAWIDFNSDGDWADAGEQIFTDETLTAGTNNLAFSVPFSATPGQTFARFRFNTTGGLSPTGLASDGEVEDYAVQTLPDADFDDDGDVDGKDLSRIIGEMGVCTGPSCECDMNGDGVVNADDLGLFAAEYGN